MNKTYRHEDKLKQTVAQLADEASLCNMCHMRWSGEPLPSQATIKKIVDLCRAILFPGFYGKSTVNHHTIAYHIGVNIEGAHNLQTEMHKTRIT